jgi:hypothetical protein
MINHKWDCCPEYCLCLYFKLFLTFKSLYIGGKSSVLLDVKPWDDETDMKKLEEAVRSIEMPGLHWGACKFYFLLSTIETLVASS